MGPAICCRDGVRVCAPTGWYLASKPVRLPDRLVAEIGNHRCEAWQANAFSLVSVAAYYFACRDRN